MKYLYGLIIGLAILGALYLASLLSLLYFILGTVWYVVTRLFFILIIIFIVVKLWKK